MTIIITSRPNNLFHRPECVKSFNDDSGSYEEAIHYIEKLIGCEYDFECKVITKHRKLVDETLEKVSTAGLVPL